MYRRFTSISAFLLFLLLTAALSAQPLTGTKYIGGASPDYTSIHDAIAVLNSNGVGVGGVTFRIRGGTYDEPPDSLMWTMNTTPDARVVFVPDDTLGIVVNKQCHSGARFAFSFNNADYVTIDGSHPSAPGRRFIAINASDTTYGQYALRFLNGSSYNAIRNVTLSVSLASSSNNSRVVFVNPSSSGQPLSGCKSDSFENCRIQGGYAGVYLTGESIIMNDSLYFANNEFVDFNVYGGYVAYTRYGVWTQNQFHRTAPGTATIYGIYQTNTNSTFTKFLGNRIYDLEGGTTSGVYGLYLSSGSNLLAANNMINLSPSAGGTVYGLYLGTNTAKVFYNTIRVAGETGGNSNSAAVTISGASQDSLLNNIFVNERTGGSLTTNYHCAATFTNASPFALSNNNVFANTATTGADNQYGIRYNSTSYNTLEDLLGAGTAYAGDSLSFSALPRLVSATDLHIDSTQRTQVEGAAQPIYIVNDFDNQTRNEVTPDIGADEGNFISGGDFTPPVIQHVGLPTYNYVTPRVVTAIITDNVGLAAAPNHPRIYSRSSVDTVWTFRNADSVRSDSIYYFVIPGVPFDEEVEYYFAAQDVIGNSLTLPYGGDGVSPPGTTPPDNLFGYFVRRILTGVMTIGPTGDYTNFAEAMDAIRTAGVADSGVTFTIANGVYEEEPLTLNGYFSRSQRILFKVDSGANVTINVTGTTASPWAIRLQRAAFVTFDGSWPRNLENHLTITGTNIGNAFRFIDSAQYNTVRKCSLLVATSSSTSNRVVQIGGGTTTASPCIGNQILDCVIVGGYSGIYARGSTAQLADSTVIHGNIVRDFYNNGITTGYGSGIRVENNQIFQSQTSTGTTVTGIYMDNGTQSSIVNANSISTLQAATAGGETGIRSYGFYNTISNNMIRLGDSTIGTVYGINFADQNGTMRTIHNTVSLSGVTNSSNSACYYNNVNSGMDTLYANIFQNLRTGGSESSYHVVFMVTQIPVVLFSNYNLLGLPSDSANDNIYMARLSGFTFNALADLQASAWSPRDSFSFSQLAPFESNENLHINPAIPTLVESGAPIHWEVNTDFDGEFRSSPYCDIGADEGTFTSSVSDMNRALPNEYRLEPIYPNPFNATASIRFTLPQTDKVKISVYDATGRFVTKLVEHELQAGTHVVRWNGVRSSSGIYFVTMQSKNFTATRKAVLLK